MQKLCIMMHNDPGACSLQRIRKLQRGPEVRVNPRNVLYELNARNHEGNYYRVYPLSLSA